MAAGPHSSRTVVRIAFVVAVALTDLVAAQAAVAQTDTTPPSVSITSPAPGGAVTGTVNVTADATDDTGVAGVQFLLDGNPLGVEKTLAPYSISWNTHGSSDLVFGAVKVKLAGMTISAGNGFTRRLAVSCSGCTGADTVSIDSIRTTSGAASAAFTFSAATHYAAHMAAFKAATTPVYVQGASATSNSGSSAINKAFGANVAAGHLLVVAVAWSGSSPVSVTDNRSNVYAAATSAYDATLGQSLAIFYAPNAAAGATTVTARFTGASPAARRLEIHEYAGMAAANPLDATAMNSADGTTLVSSITTGAMPTTVCPAAANGIHTLTAVARDLAGNRTTSAPVTFTVGADTTAPVISNVVVSSITASGATITWTTDEPGDSQVDYGVTTAYGSTTALNGALVTAHAVNLTGLVGPTLYHMRVRSADAAGNLALSDDVTFSTPDGTPPTVSLTAPAATTVAGAVTVSANAADNVGVAGVQFQL